MCGNEKLNWLQGSVLTFLKIWIKVGNSITEYFFAIFLSRVGGGTSPMIPGNRLKSTVLILAEAIIRNQF
jgi:hypothetical protein